MGILEGTVTEEELDEQTPRIVGGVKTRDEVKKAQIQVTQPVPEKGKKKQFELGEQDMVYLNQNQFSEAAWEQIGRRHKIDPATREALPGYKGRGFLAEPKNYPPLEPPVGGVLTSEGFQAISSTDGFINKRPISGKDTSAVQSELRGRKTLTVPITDVETVETV